MKPANGIRADKNKIRRRGLKKPAPAGLDSVDAISIALYPNPQLAKAAQGEAAVLAFLTDLSPRETVAQWEAWLRGYGEVLLAEAEPNQQIARGMIRLGEILAI